MKSRTALLAAGTAVFTVASFAVLSLGSTADRAATLPRAKDGNGQPPYANLYSAIQPFMEGFYEAAHDKVISIASGTRILIVPHHLLASKTIAVGVSAIRNSPVERIILLSPDHFGQCPTLLCTTSRPFQTPFGEVYPDQELLDALMSSPIVTVHPDLFTEEHGIHAVLPFIAHERPDLSITPAVLSQRIPWSEKRDRLLTLFDQLLDDRTALIVSSDFSHYLPLDEANREDAATESAISSRNPDRTLMLKNPQQSDCPGCLWIAASIANRRNCRAPQILLHTNSAIILHNTSVARTTSHYAIQWSCVAEFPATTSSKE